jgi:hypothetical protein
VHEYVLAAAIRLNKAKSLGRIEPLSLGRIAIGAALNRPSKDAIFSRKIHNRSGFEIFLVIEKNLSYKWPT